MRYLVPITGGLFCSALMFASCTCHQQVQEPPSFQQPPSGFHASSQSTPQAQAAAATPTPKALAMPPQMAAGPSPTMPAEVPADFPKDMPIYKDATLSQVQQLANNAHNVIFSTAAPVSEVSNFYQDTMTRAGWKVTQQFEREKHAFMTFQKGNLIANLTVAEDVHHPGQQVIAIMYEEQKPLDFDEF